MRKLLYLLGFIDVVWVQWDNGRPSLRIVRGRTPDYFVRCFGKEPLRRNHSTDTAFLKWFPYNEKPARGLRRRAMFRPRGIFQAWVVENRLKGG